MNSETKTSSVRDLLLGSGVMLLVYGLAIAALVSWFVLDSRNDDAGVVEVSSTEPEAVDRTIADAGTDIDTDVDVDKKVDEPDVSESLALSDFVAVPESAIERIETAAEPITEPANSQKQIQSQMLTESERETGSASIPASQSVPEQRVELTQRSTTTETEAVGVAEKVAGTLELTSQTTKSVAVATEALPPQPVNSGASSDAGKGEADAEVLVSSYDDRPVLTLTGRVINQQQAPIEGLRVFVYHADDGGESIASAVTNRGGDFHLPALEKAPYIVKTAFGDTISVFDFARSGSVDLHIVSQQGTDVATDAAQSAPEAPESQTASIASGNSVVAGSQISISGQVQSDLGAPLADVLVRYNGTTLKQTGIDGSYNISLQPGTASKVSIQFKKDGHLAEIRTLTAQTWANSNELRQDVVMRSIKLQ